MNDREKYQLLFRYTKRRVNDEDFIFYSIKNEQLIFGTRLSSFSELFIVDSYIFINREMLRYLIYTGIPARIRHAFNFDMSAASEYTFETLKVFKR